jgi:uncharacterized protein (DUF1800 family)
MLLDKRFTESASAISRTPRAFLAMFLVLTCVSSLVLDLPALASTLDKKPKPSAVLKGLPITELSEDEAIFHALNRLAYGPRPGDIERVRQMGLAKWIDQQLNPNSIDDRALQARLDNYPTLKMSTARLISEYPQPNQAAKQQGLTREEYRREQAEKRRSDAAGTIAKDMEVSREQAPARDEQEKETAKPSMENLDAPAPMKAPSREDARPPQAGGKEILLGGGDPNGFARALAEDSKRPQRVIAELSMAKITRAVYSERQLDEVLADFWFNHFNVFAAKGEDKWMLTSYERDVIRPHVFGKFKDLVTATAKSPAMLFYLDNWMSADPRAAERIAAERAARQNMRRNRPWGGLGRQRLPRTQRPPQNPQQQGQRRERGLNENYGRELMELHTLGVDGGYTQKDVTEVARCFTGWTIREPRRDPEFHFEERLHDPGPKMVLGKKIHAGGMKDGEEVIDLLVHRPSTAKFISTKLTRRFVSDNPPQALVDRMAKSFQSSDGDIHAVVKTMIYSPEFWSRDAYRAKIKTPFEFVVSAARALATDVSTPLPLVMWVARIGQPLYMCQPPTGYSDKAETWVNTGALLNRLNFSLALASNRMRGSRTDVTALLGTDAMSDAKASLDRAVQIFLGGQAASQTVETLQKQLESPQVLQTKLDDPVKQVDAGVVAGLVLGAPEFQRR